MGSLRPNVAFLSGYHCMCIPGSRDYYLLPGYSVAVDIYAIDFFSVLSTDITTRQTQFDRHGP